MGEIYSSFWLYFEYIWHSLDVVRNGQYVILFFLSISYDIRSSFSLLSVSFHHSKFWSFPPVCLPAPSVQCNFISLHFLSVLDMYLNVCLTLISCFGSWEWPPLMNGCFFPPFHVLFLCWVFLFLLNISLSLHIFWVDIRAMEVRTELKLNGRK